LRALPCRDIPPNCQTVRGHEARRQRFMTRAAA
jgi:hypothetical protein